MTSDVHPVTAAIIAIGKCTAVPSDLGTRITTLADDQDIPVRTAVKFRTGFLCGQLFWLMLFEAMRS